MELLETTQFFHLSLAMVVVTAARMILQAALVVLVVALVVLQAAFDQVELRLQDKATMVGLMEQLLHHSQRALAVALER
jgi:hypothetical protein